MAVARYKDLCIDSSTGETLGRFWAAALGLRFRADGHAGTLVGDVSEQRIWMNEVPEARTVKQRVHIDVNTTSIDDLVALGATVLEPAAEFDRAWTVLADPEGGEFCAFVRDPGTLSTYRLYELVIDSVDPRPIAAVVGGHLRSHSRRSRGPRLLVGHRHLGVAVHQLGLRTGA